MDYAEARAVVEAITHVGMALDKIAEAVQANTEQSTKLARLLEKFDRDGLPRIRHLCVPG